MTNDELRALADALEPMARAPRFEDFDVPAFCAWVRACADAKPVGYATANGLRMLKQDDATVLLYAHDYLIRPDHVALYTHPAPQPQPERQPVSEATNEIEPTEAQIEAGARVLCHRFAELCNVNEQDTWNAHCDEFRDDAAEALRAALAAKE